MSKGQQTLDKTQDRKITNWLLVIGFLLIAANLRAPLTSVGSLISFIRDDLGISASVAGSITTIPLLAFALFSPFAPKIASRIGMERTVFIALVSLVFGILLRSASGVFTLFLGTAFIGLGIAIGNVLLPGIIKMNFPLRIGIMTSMYAVSMNIFAALASGLSVPFASIGNFGWKGSLVLWDVLAIITLILWTPQLKKSKRRPKEEQGKKQETKAQSSMWKSKLAWQITGFMGMQSLVFYTIITWLPEILMMQGYSANAAGWMLFLLQFALIPITFFVPLIAESMRNQKMLSVITGVLFIAGIILLLTGKYYLMPVAAILMGIANGSAFSLSMMFFSLRTSDGKEATEISGMAQSIGYLFAATGPVLFGAMYDIASSWTIPLFMLMVVSVIILYTGIESGKDRLISEPERESF